MCASRDPSRRTVPFVSRAPLPSICPSGATSGSHFLLLCTVNSPSGLRLPRAVGRPQPTLKPWILCCLLSRPPPTPTVPPPRQADIKMGSPSPHCPRPLLALPVALPQGVDASCLLSPPPSLGWAGDHLGGRDPDHHRLHAGGLHYAGLWPTSSTSGQQRPDHRARLSATTSWAASRT